MAASKGMTAALAALMAVVMLAACDQQKMENMEVGVSTAEQVRAQWGEPVATYSEGDAQVLEYPRQPAGQKNYMIVLGADGKLKAIRQVLTAGNIGKVTPGMKKDEVRRLLGKPARMLKYDLKPDEEVWEWRWLDGNDSKVFIATFAPNGEVRSTGARADTEKSSN